MRYSILLFVFAFSCVRSKNYVTKSLTESMGQEIIEIGAPVKDLPPELDEEPSAEIDQDEEKSTTSAPAAARRETKKTITLTSTVATLKDGDPVSSGLSSDDEEKRIEKELSEIYQDTDYKAETIRAESSKAETTSFVDASLPALRQKSRVNFKFQPDVNDRSEVERFRTSVDDISCDKRVTQRLHEEKNKSVDLVVRNSIAICLTFLMTLVCQ